MSRKRVQSYNDMVRLMAEMQRKMEVERKRMSAVMSAALLDDLSAAKLGDYSDHDLRRIMALLAGHIDSCIEVLEQEKEARKCKAADQTNALQQMERGEDLS